MRIKNNNIPSVSIQGEVGSYSELVSLKLFGKNQVIKHYRSFESSIKSVINGIAKYTVIPFENAATGYITECYRLLFKYNLMAIEEIGFRIKHCLLTKDFINTSEIKRIYSHKQAILQCSRFLTGLKKADIIPVFDTAGAANFLHQEGNKNAIIASRRAAEVYGLQILAKDIQDDKLNTTKFFVLSKNRSANLKGTIETLLGFTLKPNGILFDEIINEFNKNSVHLNKNLSFKIRADGTTERLYFVSFTGDTSENYLRSIMAKIKNNSSRFRVLGSYSVGNTYKS